MAVAKSPKLSTMDEVYERLRAAILDRTYPPGTKLDEEALDLTLIRETLEAPRAGLRPCAWASRRSRPFGG